MVHLPVNVASQIQITVKAMRDLGVEARGLIRRALPSHSSSGLETYYGSPVDPPRLTPRWFWYHVVAASRVLAAIRWADVVHYHYGGTYALPGGLDVAWTCALGKPRLINFWGSDIRIPEIESRGNPYYARRDRTYEYWGAESYDKSRRVQTYYARRGFTFVCSESLLPHIQTDLSPTVGLVRSSVDLKQLEPHYPDPKRRRAVVVHSPSAPVAKGTPAVLSAVDALRNEHRLDFDFVLVHNKPRQQALDILKGADIFLDQFVVGGYGLAAVEAMAFGKPVVCYIKPSLEAQYPSGMPIVNANQDNLSEVLERLIKDGELRHQLGRRSRAYVEEHHDAHKIAHQLVAIYEELLSKQ